MKMLTKEGYLMSSTLALEPKLLGDGVQCSTFVSYDELEPEDIKSSRFEGVKCTFMLTDIVDTFIEANKFRNGKLDVKDKLLVNNMIKELESMVKKLDALKFERVLDDDLTP
jgi:hypothetical protein